MERIDGPTCLLLSRQSVAHQARTPAQLDAIARGGYVLRDSEGTPDAILVATGSEVGIAVEAAEIVAESGVAVRVVSMPSTDVFDAQSESYRNAVLPPAVSRRMAA